MKTFHGGKRKRRKLCFLRWILRKFLTLLIAFFLTLFWNKWILALNGGIGLMVAFIRLMAQFCKWFSHFGNTKSKWDLDKVIHSLLFSLSLLWKLCMWLFKKRKLKISLRALKLVMKSTNFAPSICR